ncbi:competence protein ComEA [Orenia metallireducens]|jgi:competence protein ComEA|uniref:Competence protein ComEA n=1 Tax=Orenia metallireducens TaxID=1413210 RepID=A0A285I5C5_9FIRM|nr:helix-hairpin-helix domain-containing protein [Orenia metallireducens]PRX19725.1 competence protein ComEA [Orenia metallireducens]SNY43168.1 competence protein ComEA [Orenia metallireducens]
MMVKEDGYALFLVLIILTIFALLFPAVLRLTITEFMIAKNYQESISDYYLIEGIVDLGVSEAYNGLDKLEYISQANLQLLCNNEKSLEIIDSSNHKLTVKYKILEIVDESSKVNINIASKEMLASLDEIGESIAEDIIAKRDFNTIEELSQVSGIGNAGGESESKTYENIKDDVTVRSDGRININTASSSVLKSLSNIGDTLFDNIKSSRPFANKIDIKSVDGIGDVIYSNLENKIKVTSHNFKVRLEVSIEDKEIKREITRFIELK